jgi:hypothetical protein
MHLGLVGAVPPAENNAICTHTDTLLRYLGTLQRIVGVVNLHGLEAPNQLAFVPECNCGQQRLPVTRYVAVAAIALCEFKTSTSSRRHDSFEGT